MKKPGKMRWEYRSPREKLFVSDGKDAWFFVPGRPAGAQDWMRGRLDDIRSPLAFLLGKIKLEKEFAGAIAGSRFSAGKPPGMWCCEAYRRLLAGRVSEILLEVTPQHRIARIVINEADGSVTEYRFSEQKEDEAISGRTVRFSPAGDRRR